MPNGKQKIIKLYDIKNTSGYPFPAMKIRTFISLDFDEETNRAIYDVFLFIEDKTFCYFRRQVQFRERFSSDIIVSRRYR